MIRRLTAFDLPGRLKSWAPRLVIQLAVGALFAATAILARWLVDIVAHGVAPFALLFPAILLATGLAGWEAGAVTLTLGGLFSWYYLLPPGQTWTLSFPESANLGLFGLSGLLVIAAAAAYRATALALKASEERLGLATHAAQVGVWEWRLDTGRVFYSAEARRICGFAPDGEVTFEMVQGSVHPDDLPLTKAQSDQALDPDRRDDRPYEYRIIRPGGELRWVHARGRAVFEPGLSGRLEAVRYVGTLQDVTTRKADEERLRLLAREVDHRANNLMAVVQGTVALSQAADPEALKTVITGRVNALARAHQLLAQARWEGADLRRLVEEELLAFSLGDEARVAVRGAQVALPPAAAQSLAMALHELATNAAKYGALSVPGGRVEVSWAHDAEGGLEICWRERGGPPVRKPNRKGLGTTLLGRALAGPIRGWTTLDWRPEGLVCQLRLPPAALELAVAPPAVTDREAEQRSRSAR